MIGSYHNDYAPIITHLNLKEFWLILYTDHRYNFCDYFLLNLAQTKRQHSKYHAVFFHFHIRSFFCGFSTDGLFASSVIGKRKSTLFSA